MFANLAYTKQRSEDRVNDPRLPVRSRSRYCRGARRRAAILILTSTLTRKFLELSRHAGEIRKDRVCAPSNGFWPPFMTSIGPAIGAHDRR
jgi:hypothetical protein